MKKKIMIVDDDPDILIAFRQVFENHGFKVYTVDSGIDCLNEIERGFTGVVLMDIMMPFMDGWETIEKIKKKNLGKNVKISIITAKGCIDNTKLKEFSPYIFDYVIKPIDLKNLVSNVKKMFNS